MRSRRAPKSDTADTTDVDDLDYDLKALERLSRAELSSRWRDLLGSDPPKGISQRLMLGAVAYAIQAKRLGGLSSAARRRLDVIATESGKPVTSPTPMSNMPAPGSRLIREWNGTTHIVDMVDGGYLWNGARHRSLSSIALAITGTQWSGPRFFGLRSRAKP